MTGASDRQGKGEVASIVSSGRGNTKSATSSSLPRASSGAATCVDDTPSSRPAKEPFRARSRAAPVCGAHLRRDVGLWPFELIGHDRREAVLRMERLTKAERLRRSWVAVDRDDTFEALERPRRRMPSAQRCRGPRMLRASSVIGREEIATNYPRRTYVERRCGSANECRQDASRTSSISYEHLTTGQDASLAQRQCSACRAICGWLMAVIGDSKPRAPSAGELCSGASAPSPTSKCRRNFPAQFAPMEAQSSVDPPRRRSPREMRTGRTAVGIDAAKHTSAAALRRRRWPVFRCSM